MVANELIVTARTENSVVTGSGATIRDSHSRKSIARPEKPVRDSFLRVFPVLHLLPIWAWTPHEIVPESDVVS